eukprot:6165892-Pyramimonas_sp.AAC.1
MGTSFWSTTPRGATATGSTEGGTEQGASDAHRCLLGRRVEVARALQGTLGGGGTQQCAGAAVR